MAVELDNFINNVCSADEWLAGPENHDFVEKLNLNVLTLNLLI